MKQERFFSLLGVAALAVLLCSPAGAAIIFADNFNTPAFPVGVDLITYAGGSQLSTTPSTAPGIFGWFVGGAGIDHISPTIGHVGSDGGAWIDLNSLDAGSIELAIVGAFTPGSNYTLSFQMASATPGNSINVEVTNGYAVPGFTPSTLATGVATPTTTNVLGGTPLTTSSWTPYSIGFTADVTQNIVIKFTSNGSGPFGAFIDNVQVSNIPEPSTLALGGLGLVVIALIRRRRTS